jgi:hypothetical protein
MSKPFEGTISIDIKDSKPDWGPYSQPMAPPGRRACCMSSWTTSASRRWSRTAG